MHGEDLMSYTSQQAWIEEVKKKKATECKRKQLKLT
jgi:hypothetical protein